MDFFEFILYLCLLLGIFTIISFVNNDIDNDNNYKIELYENLGYQKYNFCEKINDIYYCRLEDNYEE